MDRSMITGNPVPAFKAAGEVVGGTMNKNGSLTFKATRVGKDTVLAGIIALVRRPRAQGPPCRRLQTG